MHRDMQLRFNSDPFDTNATAWFINFLTNRTQFPLCGVPLSQRSWDINTSPWSTPRHCAWPVDHGQNRYVDKLNYTIGNDTDAYGTCGFYRSCPFKVFSIPISNLHTL